MTFIIIVIIILIVWFILWRKSYKLSNNFMTAFTGTMGSGKTFLALKMAIRFHKKSIFKTKIYNVLHKKNRILPLLYSDIPLNYKYYTPLTEEHILMLTPIIKNSVVFIDEVGYVIPKETFKNQKIRDKVVEFFRLSRHYWGFKHGRLIITEQSSDDIEVDIRRRCGIINNLNSFKKWLGIFYTVEVFEVKSVEGLMTISQASQLEETRPIIYGILPLPFISKRRYDSYCYSELYSCKDNENKSKPLKVLTLKSDRLIQLYNATTQKK